MLHKLLSTIERHRMIAIGDKVLVGVSGGADSIALLHMLNRLKAELKIELAVAHINHGLRGKDAHGDASYVANLCEQWGIPFFLKEVDVGQLSRAWGLSEEEVGRRVRFEFFDQVLSQLDGDKIALGHHQDDQVETILHNIIRGTGLEGLRGIKPIRDGKIIRPLLEIGRQEIERYLHGEGLSYRHDRTNDETIYTRNKLRLELIPYIDSELNARFTDSIIRMADILGAEDDFLSAYTCQLMEGNISKEPDRVAIPIAFLQSCHLAIQRRVLRSCIEELSEVMTDIGQKHIDGVLHMCNLNPGSTMDLPLGLIVYRDYDTLILTRESIYSHGGFDIELHIPGTVFIEDIGIDITARHVKKIRFGDPNCVYIDGDTISHTLRVRSRIDGDRFRPFGMRGSKKLKDFFIDEKIPRYERDAIPLVVDDGNIVWVAGHQIGDDYKITEDTDTIIELVLSKR